MDTVLFIFTNNRAYVGDFYKGELKKIIFKEVDYWEIYGRDDVENLLEYLNYPLGYNKFKGNEVKILIDKPLTYNYLYETRHFFKYAEAVTIGKVMPFLMAHLQREEIEEKTKIDFANQFYEVTYIEKIGLIKEEEDLETSYKRIDEKEIYQLMLDKENEQEEYKGKAEEIFEKYIILSPTIIYKEIEAEGKGYYLKVDNQLVKEKVVQDNQQVAKGEVLFSYTHTVQKLWGRKKVETIDKRSLKEGIFYQKERNQDNNLWANKNEVLGIISSEDTKAESLKWLKYIE